MPHDLCRLMAMVQVLNFTTWTSRFDFEHPVDGAKSFPVSGLYEYVMDSVYVDENNFIWNNVPKFGTFDHLENRKA